jgi:hypothetical protein
LIEAPNLTPLYGLALELGGRLSTVDLLGKVTGFEQEVNNNTNIKRSYIKLVSTRRSTVLRLPLQQEVPDNSKIYEWEKFYSRGRRNCFSDQFMKKFFFSFLHNCNSTRVRSKEMVFKGAMTFCQLAIFPNANLLYPCIA